MQLQLYNVQSNKVKALEKAVKAFTDSDLNEIMEIQNPLGSQSRRATNKAVKELMKSEEALKPEDELCVENMLGSHIDAPATADARSATDNTPNRLTYSHQ